MNTCIICGEPAPNGLCESCTEELFKGEPVLAVEFPGERETEFFLSSLEDADSAGWPTNYV